MKTDFYPMQYKLKIMQSKNWTQSYVTGDIQIIKSNSHDGSHMAQKRKYGSHKLRCRTCKRFCNATSRTIYQSDFLECSAVEASQYLCKVPEQMTLQVMYLHGWDASRETVVLPSSTLQNWVPRSRTRQQACICYAQVAHNMQIILANFCRYMV